MSSATPSATNTAVSSAQPAAFKVVGVILAIVSGLLIGSSFVFKKKGLIASQKGGPAGEGVGYLKSYMWWTGMIMMIVGEICNFGSYAFIPAIIVTPLGALSVVICAILSSIFLQESLTFFGWIGCFLCIVGSVIIALNGPEESSAATIKEFQHLFLSLGFIVFGSAVILAALIIIFFIAPQWGDKNMLWYILICSLFGGLSVSCTQGLGASIVTSIRAESQFKYWFIYFLMVFVAITLVTEIFFLNKALALFNTAMVTPTYYVIFTFFTLVTSVILYQGLHATPVQIITVVLGFLVICCGIVILQMSKVDPTQLKLKLGRRTTMLLQASHSHTERQEKNEIVAMEEPGLDALRGSFGALGSFIRARSVRSMQSQSRGVSQHHSSRFGSRADEERGSQELTTHGFANLPRHQLYDAPVPHPDPSLPPVPEDDVSSLKPSSAGRDATRPPPTTSPRTQTIRFEPTQITHYYPAAPGKGGAVHQQRNSAMSMSTQPGSQVPDYSDGEDEAFDPGDVPLAHTRGASERFLHHGLAERKDSDPFRDSPNPSAASLLDARSGDISESGGTASQRASSEETRRPFHNRSRAYPGGHESDEDDMARESLVAHDSGSTRGGIRLIPSKSPRKL